jgi:hypothetical protein
VLRGVRCEDVSALSIDERLEESGPAVDGEAEKKGAHFVPQAAHGMVFEQRLLKEGTTPLLELIDQKGQHGQHGKDAGQILGSVAVVMFEMVALVLERVEGLVFDVPAGPASSHNSIDDGLC